MATINLTPKAGARQLRIEIERLWLREGAQMTKHSEPSSRFDSVVTRRAFNLGMAASAVAVAAPGSAFAQSRTAPEGELRIGVLTFNSETFHPIWQTSNRGPMLTPLYDHIVGADATGKLDPAYGLATAWEPSSDLLTYTFTLRTDVKFHDGSPVTPQDVAYTIMQAGTAKNVSGGMGSAFKTFVKSAEVVDNNKVVVKLNAPWPHFLFCLSPTMTQEGMVVPQRLVEADPTRYDRLAPIGSGPYKFLEIKSGSYVRYEAQPSHFRTGVPRYRYLRFQLIPEEQSRVAALKAGDVDVILSSVEGAKNLRKDGFKILEAPRALDMASRGYLRSENPNMPYTTAKSSGLLVRKALALAVDKTAIHKQVLDGLGEPMGVTQPMYSRSLEYQGYSNPVVPYDPAEAKKLLAEAGYGGGFDIGIYSFVTISPEQPYIDEAVAGYWSAIGVRARLLTMDFAAFRPIWIREKEPTGPSTFNYAGASRISSNYQSGLASNGFFSCQKIPEVDAMIADLEKQTTIEGYVAGARKIMDYQRANYMTYGIATIPQLVATRPNIASWDLGMLNQSMRFEYA